MPRLDIPRNCYEDLQARFELEDDLIQRMAARDILYDRGIDSVVQETAYFQFYSRAFAGRVFFEVVERRGYDAFGAANASIRLAAQARYKPEYPDWTNSLTATPMRLIRSLKPPHELYTLLYPDPRAIFVHI